MTTADKNIGSLPSAESVSDDALLVAEIQGVAVKITGAQLKALVKAGVEVYVASAREAAASAQEAANAAQAAAGGIGTALEDTMENAEAAQAAWEGAEEARAAIENMVVDAITLATGTPASVSKSLVDGVVKLVFGLPSGPQGEKGAPGASIQSIQRTSGNGAAGTVDTYTITLTDGTIAGTFQVQNGANGAGAGDMLESVYDPQGKKMDIFQYVDDALGGVTAEVPIATKTTAGKVKIGSNVNVSADGTISVPNASTGARGVTYLVDAVNRSDTDKAATANAVKKAYDLASGKQNKLEGVSGQVVGFNANGDAEPQDAPNGLPAGEMWQVIQYDADGNPQAVSELNLGGLANTMICTTDQDTGFIGGQIYNDGTGYIGISGLIDPEYDDDAANKRYVDQQIGNIGDILDSINGEVI